MSSNIMNAWYVWSIQKCPKRLPWWVEASCSSLGEDLRPQKVEVRLQYSKIWHVYIIMYIKKYLPFIFIYKCISAYSDSTWHVYFFPEAWPWMSISPMSHYKGPKATCLKRVAFWTSGCSQWSYSHTILTLKTSDRDRPYHGLFLG